MSCTTAVIGGGAAGLMAAGRLAELGGNVIVFEKMHKTALKLGITGKGRCNITNNCTPQEFIPNVVSNPRFLQSAIHHFPPAEVMSFFEALGVPVKTERGNRVFPASDRAHDVVMALRRYADCQVIQQAVTGIVTENGAVTGVRTAQGITPCDRVLLCTGGRSYPQTGSDGSGYALAEALGHTVTPISPSLVPLEVEERWCADLQGLSLRNIAVRLIDSANGKTVYEDFGEMIFTHFGLSGPVILSLSAHIKPGKQYTVSIDLKPALDDKTLDSRLLSDFGKYANKDFINALDDLLPQKIIPTVVELSGISPRKKVNEITREERHALAGVLRSFTLTFRRFRPIDEAIVTRGGVSVKEINPKTMESKLVSGLYFAGEVMDLDAYTGGFNLQIAFCTARLAADSILENQ